MIQAKCIQKFRDKNNNIKGYLLEDYNGQQLRIAPDQLKNAIFMQQINVINLKLTKDGKLIDKEEQVKLESSCEIKQIKYAFDELWDYMQSLGINENWPETMIDESAHKIIILLEKIYKTKFKQIHTQYDGQTYVLTSGKLTVTLCYMSGYGDEYDMAGDAWCICLPANGYEGIGYCFAEDDEVRKHIKFMHWKMIESTINLAHSNEISYYNFTMSALEIISKLSDAKYATVARYIVPGEIGEEDAGSIYQSIRYKGNIKDNKRDNMVNIDIDLILVCMHPIKTDNRYAITVYIPNKFNSCCKRFSEYKIENAHSNSKYELFIDPCNKNFKQEIKLFIEQRFKQSYNNIRYYLDSGEYT